MLISDPNLHDTSVIRKALESISERLSNEFDFSNHGFTGHEQFSNLKLVNDYIDLTFYISTREGIGYEITDAYGNKHTFQSLSVKIYPRRSDQRKQFLNERYEHYGIYETSDPLRYKKQIEFDFDFINENFPELLRKGLITK